MGKIEIDPPSSRQVLAGGGGREGNPLPTHTQLDPLNSTSSNDYTMSKDVYGLRYYGI